ncbi:MULTISPECIES: hypothetical protein [unclassified Streptomyces]|uniref:hypothetical protein n=1 Tax=unclassified Streptomyces TaxID=2593676 RepID=UPI0029AA4577|nr:MULTISPECIES: hypothetical protein [unclassified Streptomyces]MDX3766435.1 hypothetical protein [Streptomyces sp. AK08-01B]MDX3816308.1 hypothetical protein [Streptomyces sp. AK08-01A]
MDSSARAAALVRVNELDETEPDARARRHLERFQEAEGREMTDQEFREFVSDYRRGIITLNPPGEVVVRQVVEQL